MGDYLASPTKPVARKAHQCTACFGQIPVREKHVQQSGFYDGFAFRNRFHFECWDILSSEGEFEFCPGDLDVPERIVAMTAKEQSRGR
jgi:hypothetical protein